MTRRTVEGQAIELDWVRSNAWQLADADYLTMVELKTSWYSFITPLQVGALAAGARPEQLAALEAARPAPRSRLPDHRRPAEPAGHAEDYGKEIGGDLWEGKRTLMLLHALRRAEPADRNRALQILAKRRPAADTELRLGALLDELTARDELSATGRAEILAQLRALDSDSAKTLDDVRWLYRLLRQAGSLDHARAVAGEQADAAAAVLAALDWWPASRHRDVLGGLVDYVHERSR